MQNAPAYQSLSEIENDLSTLFSSGASGQLSVSDPQLGSYRVAMSNYRRFFVLDKTLRTTAQPLNIWSSPEEPALLMMFTLQGQPVLAGQGWEKPVAARQQLFDVYPAQRSVYHAPAGSTVQSLCIELFPGTALLDGMMQEDNELGDLLYRTLVKGEKLHALRGNLPFDPLTDALVQDIQGCRYGGKTREVYLEAQTQLLLIHQLSRVHQLQHQGKDPADGKLSGADVERLYALRGYLEDHFLEEHSLQGLARRFGLNLFKLKYGFKKLFGTSTMRFVDEKKLHYAHALLKEPHTSIAELSDSLRYEHPSSFTAAFKRKFGYPPQVLRKM
jgi:AraC-like DNA-binding protein